MTTVERGGPLVGRSVRRVEDGRILTGRGRFVGDLLREGMLEAAFVRSPVAHGVVRSIDTAQARALPGVAAVLTHQDLEGAVEDLGLGFVPPDFLAARYPALAAGKVRHVGEPIALVLARSRALAEDARDAVEVEVDALEPVVAPEEALDPTKPPAFEELGTNVARRAVRTFGDPGAALAAADRVVHALFRLPRVSAAPMETRGGLAEYDAATGVLAYTSGTRNAHGLRAALCAALRLPPERVDVVAPDMGGAFGQKNFASREDVCVCFAAISLGRPVRWLEDRAENLVGYVSGRGERFEVDVAVGDDGTVLALDVRALLDQGAYAVAAPLSIFGTSTAAILPNAYRIDHLRWDETDVITNTASWSSLRGPWAGETLLREVALDAVARELSLDPVEVRRRNLVPLEEQPRPLPTGMTLEGSTALACLERALDLAGYDALRAEQRRAREEGRLLGVGVATYVEPTPGPPDYGAAIGFEWPEEKAEAVLEADGTVTVSTSQVPHGQGHETTLAQIAAAELELPLDRIRVVVGDTRVTPAGLGTGGSRASSMAAGAVLHASRALGEEIRRAGAPSPGLRGTASFRSGRGGWSGGTHVCAVEVDPETGVVSILRYVVAEDCGKLINPAIVEGQVRGGVAMGIGMALLEDAAYDEDGNPASTLMDYLLPTAMEVPPIEVAHLESEPLHELDYRGVGEGGTIGATPAVVNAIADALGGIDEVELPLTPSRVLELLDRRRADR